MSATSQGSVLFKILINNLGNKAECFLSNFVDNKKIGKHFIHCDVNWLQNELRKKF